MGVIGRAPVVERIDLSNEPEFDLGGMRVKPSERAVEMNGERQELQPRVMQVLVALAQARPTVVSRDKLVVQCWDGRIVGDDSLNRCILALRHLAEEFDPQPFAIETVPRVGHRLVESGGGAAAANPAKPKLWLLVAVLLVSLLAGLGLFAWQQRSVVPDPASIAVLPFRNLSSGDSYFAEGIGEEIMSQLAREPEFRVAGSASSAQFSGPSDPRKVGRALGVDYILEGSVRPEKDRVRINASLIQTSDGKRLWSETYDRKVDDILEIQSAIGHAVANGLKRRLIHSPQAAGYTVNGEAYTLYLNARGLLRSQNPQSGQDAVTLLQEAVRLDPTFALAWASLAEALQLDGMIKGTEGMIAVLPRARVAASRALRLDPNLAHAHAIMARLVGENTSEGIAHLRRAVALDGRSGESLMWLGTADNVSGKFTEGLAAYRRAHEVDPLWPVPVRALVDLNSMMGDRGAAEAIVQDSFRKEPETRDFALARVAWLTGNFSEAARRWSGLANGASRWAAPSRTSLQDALVTLNLSKDLPARPSMPSLSHSRYPPRFWRTATPSEAKWREHNRSPAAALIYHDENVVAAKRMLASGRARELVATYDTPIGLLGIRRGRPLEVCFLQSAALVALALRDVGREEEAKALLLQSDALLRAEYKHGKVPTWFDDDAAAIWALQGRADLAVDALERALRRGSAHATRTDLARLADEPALRSLRGNTRFQAVRSKYEAHYAKEREETARALKIPS